MERILIAICLLWIYLFVGSFVEFKQCGYFQTVYYVAGAILLAMYFVVVLGRREV